MGFHSCIIRSIERETKSCVSLHLEVDDSYPRQWLPGQHLMLRIEVAGKKLQRCYSLSQPCDTGQLRLTVKDNGQQGMSGFINSKLTVGTRAEISEPAGKFYVQTSNRHRKSYYFFAAGSGITPIFSMISAILEHEPESFVYCLYGNREHKQVIFNQALQQLHSDCADRFALKHALSSASWLSSFNAWRYCRIDQDAVQAFIQQNPPYAQECEYYICGPGNFIQDVTSFLTTLDVPPQLIFSESFGGQQKKQKPSSADAMLTVDLGQQHQLEVKAGQTLLEAILEHGLDAPFSCQAGVCGTCACKLKQGKVTMLAHMALDEQQLKDNVILACQAVAETSQLEISFAKTDQT